MPDYGHVLGRDDIRIDQLSEEHGRLVRDGPIGLQVGDRVRIVPNHACVVSNLVDQVHVISAEDANEDGKRWEVWPVAARGRITQPLASHLVGPEGHAIDFHLAIDHHARSHRPAPAGDL